MKEHQKTIISFILAILYIACSIAVGMYVAYRFDGYVGFNNLLFVSIMSTFALVVVAIIGYVVYLLAVLIKELFF